MRTRHSVPSRLRLRRRLLLTSAPPAVIVLIAAIKMISVVVVGGSASSNYADGNAEALRRDAAVLGVLNVIEPAKASIAAGTSAVLDDRLADADARFSEALARLPAERSCPVVINLELVRERQGDVDAWENRPDAARDRYLSALDLAADSPPGCFAGNEDPDPERRAVRNDTMPRLTAKLAGLGAPPPPPPAAPPPQSPPPAPAVPAPESERPALRLDPGAGDPIDRLRQILQDAAAD